MYQKILTSHKFFKVPLDRDQVTFSVGNLLTRLLLSILDLYEQKFATLLKNKVVARLNNRSLSFPGDAQEILSDTQLLPIKYGCPIGLLLASEEQTSPQVISDRLRQLLIEGQNKPSDKTKPPVYLEVVSSGWLNFYLDCEFIAYWLERSRLEIDLNVRQSNKSIYQKLKSLSQTPVNLFQVQYVHARCCSLLRLGAKENLITLSNNQQDLGWQIEQPRSIPWLDRDNRLWLEGFAEHNLLHQLLTVTDCWERRDDTNWTKIALSLSQATAIFQAECRFLGEIQVQTPQLAIARLGLIALARYWLHQILCEKLQVAAPTTL